MQRIIIAGTGANQWAAEFWYRPLAQALDAKIMCLCGFGLDHPIRTVHKIIQLREGDDCQLIGHSQGGLVAAMAAGVLDIDKVVTLGAPLRGVTYPSLPIDFPGLAYMRATNKALERLIGNENMMTISTEMDSLVPPSSAHLDGTQQIYLKAPGHTWMPHSRKITSIVKEFLDG